jgi:hypothetical protein
MVVNIRSMAMAAAVISSFAVAQKPAAAACTGTVIQYLASGQFGATPIAGSDKYKLAGEPFSISLQACETLTPTKTGSDYAEYYPLGLEGTVKSSLENNPVKLCPGPPNCPKMNFTLIAPATGSDSVEIQGTVTEFGAQIPIKGDISLPAGTLSATCTNGAPANTCIAPFAKVSIVTGGSEFTYSAAPWAANHAYALGVEILDPHGNAQEVTTAGTSGATQPTWNETTGGSTTDGTVVWACEGPYTPTALSVRGSASGTVYTGSKASAKAMLHTGAVQVITLHADGSQSVRSLKAGPVDPAATFDRVMLQFYASGVRDASEVHVQIGGQEVPVLYAGAADHFPGLDEVTVEVPRSLAGMGNTEVAMTVDGQAASPVSIHIQ